MQAELPPRRTKSAIGALRSGQFSSRCVIRLCSKQRVLCRLIVFTGNADVRRTGQAGWLNGRACQRQPAGAWPAAEAALAITAMSAGRTRQHPPVIFAPAAIHCRGCAAEYRDCPVQARRRASQSSPLLG